ncbi:MAG: FAD:protein FMN transferase [Deltaproteobacteria bacterium]|nr:FAD:protein FMN transferase [Deltaproteobacteria bacterium]
MKVDDFAKSHQCTFYDPIKVGGGNISRRLFSTKVVILLALLALVPILQSCGSPKPFRETRFLMGTLVEIVAYPDTPRVRKSVGHAFKRMTDIEALAGPHSDTSPLALLREGKKVNLPEDLRRILQVALDTARRSSGAFDPTMGKVIRLWGFDGDNPGIPSPAELDAAMKTVGYARLKMGSGGEAASTGPVWIDLGGVAKGYAVDAAVHVLEKEGVKAGIVNAGGDLRAFGKRPGRKTWRIGIQDPDKPQGMAGVLDLVDGSVATSGDYERYFTVDGVRYHHILDPKTGRPARSGLRSTTVITSDCVLADALATAAFVLGPEKGLDLLERMPDVEGVLIAGGGRILKTSGTGSVVRFEKR